MYYFGASVSEPHTSELNSGDSLIPSACMILVGSGHKTNLLCRYLLFTCPKIIHAIKFVYMQSSLMHDLLTNRPIFHAQSPTVQDASGHAYSIELHISQ